MNIKKTVLEEFYKMLKKELQHSNEEYKDIKSEEKNKIIVGNLENLTESKDNVKIIKEFLKMISES